ncbi:hypothetical protein Gotur_004216 [Gossypium turneri]
MLCLVREFGATRIMTVLGLLVIANSCVGMHQGNYVEQTDTRLARGYFDFWKRILEEGLAEWESKVLKRDIPWETYMTTKLISGTGLQLLRRFDNRAESVRAQLLDDDGPAYVQVFVSILRDIFKEETVEYVLALIDEMLTANPKRARLFHDKSLANEDTYEPFLS